MNFFKTTAIAGVLSVSMVLPAFADAVQATQFNAADTQAMFEQSAVTSQVAALSSQEMKETQGAFLITGTIIIATKLYLLNALLGGNRWYPTTGTGTGCYTCSLGFNQYLNNGK